MIFLDTTYLLGIQLSDLMLLDVEERRQRILYMRTDLLHEILGDDDEDHILAGKVVSGDVVVITHEGPKGGPGTVSYTHLRVSLFHRECGDVLRKHGRRNHLPVNKKNKVRLRASNAC